MEDTDKRGRYVNYHDVKSVTDDDDDDEMSHFKNVKLLLLLI